MAFYEPLCILSTDIHDDECAAEGWEFSPPIGLLSLPTRVAPASHFPG
jgi:hypothetical protein